MHRYSNILSHGLSVLLLLPLLLVLATPLMVNKELANPTVSAKYSWFAVTLLSASFSALFIGWLNKRKINLSVVDLLITLFSLWGIALTYYLQGSFSFKPTVLLLLCVFYWVCRLTVGQHRSYSSLLLTGLLLTGLVEAVWGLGQLYGYSPSQHTLFKTTGSFYNSGPYAGYLALTLPIAVYYLLFDSKKIQGSLHLSKTLVYLRWGLALLTFLLIIVILPATMSRASWIAATFACVYLLIVYLLQERKKALFAYYQQHQKKLITGAWIGGLLLMLALGGIYALKKDSADGRAFMWKHSLTAMYNHPMGVGIGHFSGAYGEAQTAYFAKGKGSAEEERIAGSPEYAFNEYLQIGVELGIVALILFVLTMGRVLYIGYQNKHHAAVSALLALLVFAALSYPFNLLSFLLVLVLLITLCLIKTDQPKAGKREVGFYLFILIAAILAIGTAIYPYRTLEEDYRTWNRVKMLHNMGIDEKQAVAYDKLYLSLRHENTFLFEYAQCLNRLERQTASNELLKEMAQTSCDPMVYNVMGRNYQALGKTLEAEKAFQTASYLIPSRLYPYYLLTKLYDENGEAEKVRQMARLVVEKEPKIQSEAIREMKEEVQTIYDKYQPE